MKNLIILLMVTALAVAGYYYFSDKDKEVTANPESVVSEASYSWQFIDKGEDENATPQTEVFLNVPGDSISLGVENGSCSEIKGSGWELLENEESGVICWWAGGGTEFGIFVEDGKRVVKKGFLDEGSAEIPGIRGDFSTITEIE